MRIDVESSFHAGKAMELFLDGYNCAQSVFTAFCDLHLSLIHISEPTRH